MIDMTNGQSFLVYSEVHKGVRIAYWWMPNSGQFLYTFWSS